MNRCFFALLVFSMGSTLVQAGDPNEDALRERMIKAGRLPGYLQSAAMPSSIDLLPPRATARATSASAQRQIQRARNRQKSMPPRFFPGSPPRFLAH